MRDLAPIRERHRPAAGGRRSGTGIVRAGIVSAALALGAVLGAQPAQAEDLKVVRYVGFSEPKTLDPVASWLAVAFQHGYLIYDTLFSRDSHGQAQPEMVDSWTVSEDKKHYRFTLRDGLKFHDGSPVAAARCCLPTRPATRSTGWPPS